MQNGFTYNGICVLFSFVKFLILGQKLPKDIDENCRTDLLRMRDRKKESFEILLKEGKRYLFVMEEFYDDLKKMSCDEKLLSLLDRYSRYKIQLREDMEKLREMYDDDITADDYDDDDDDNDDAGIEDENEMEYMEIDLEEDEDLFLEEEFQCFCNIMYRKYTLANMEMFILRLLKVNESSVNLQLSIYSKLQICLKEYCKRVQMFLKRNKTCAKSQEGFKNKELNTTAKKFKQLQKLLLTLKEVQLNGKLL
ncbi:hypothetical protein K0M31_006519 [Melipona bicolor]|uniref:Uncharacterized protein n=1 Tax=Melipona bicolor TaxID=60889 RepID=A0AA40FTT6_9HYME|nr:hypothetical protein K0M31_006519 [Melipona bicolor]